MGTEPERSKLKKDQHGECKLMDSLEVPEIIDTSAEKDLTRAERYFFDKLTRDLTPRQIEILKNICQIETLPKNKSKFFQMVGVARSTWYLWKQDTIFLDALNNLGKIRHADDLLWADESIAAKAREGDVTAGRYLREVLGIKPESENRKSFDTVVFAQILPTK